MEGFYDWFLDLVNYGDKWTGSEPLYFSEIAFTILLIQYAFIVYKTIIYKGNLNRVLFGHMPFLSSDKLSMIPENDKTIIYFVRFFGSIGLIFFNYFFLDKSFVVGTVAMSWPQPTFNVAIWFLCYMAQEGSYK